MAEHSREHETWGGLLTHLILVPSWVVPMLLNPVMLALTGANLGLLGAVLGLLPLGLVYAGPDSNLLRGASVAFYWALALSPSDHYDWGRWPVVGAAYATLICWMICGQPFAPREGFFQFMTQFFPLQSYYRQCELRGAVDELKKGRTCIAAYPHGCLAVGFGMNLIWNSELHERTGRIHFLIDYGLRYRNPQFRLLADSYEGKLRTMDSADKATIARIMSLGESWCFLPGGFTDATVMKYGKHRVAVKDKAGWIKHCLRGGYRVVPAYTFGEVETYFTFEPFLKWRLKLNDFNLPGVAFVGNPWIPFLPFRSSRILTYLGPALQLPQISEPTTKDVEEWHAKYVAALQDLFEKYKCDAGYPDAKLELW